jgi:PIN domain nuclease of toxin-antitoxin system
MGAGELSGATRQELDRALADDALHVSFISFWEVAMLVAKGRLRLAGDLGAWRRSLLGEGLRELPVDGAIGIAAVALEAFHGDPADRLIVASAIAAGATLVTADRGILSWPSDLRRISARD